MKKAIVIFIIIPLLLVFSFSFTHSICPADSVVRAAGEDRPLIGAIRWDAWLPINQPTFGSTEQKYYIGFQVARSLGPAKYHFRLPYFAISLSDTQMDFPRPSQKLTDTEIEYAKYAGIDYFAYVYYEDSGLNSDGSLKTGMDNALDLHLSSQYKDDVKWCYIVEQSRLTMANIPQIVERMQRSNYQTVKGGRPLFYLFDSDKWTAAQVENLRNAARNAGLLELYIVYMGTSSNGAAAQCTALDCQAISAYCTFGNNGQSYASLASNELGKWNEWKNTGKKVIPVVTTGWDTRPRFDNPVSWTTVQANSWAQTATASEIANHLNEAINWSNSNKTANEANVVLMYAWNEHDEGGWLCPTVQVDANGKIQTSMGYNKINSDRIEALHSLLNVSPGATVPTGWITPTPNPIATPTAVSAVTDYQHTNSPYSTIPPDSTTGITPENTAYNDAQEEPEKNSEGTATKKPSEKATENTGNSSDNKGSTIIETVKKNPKVWLPIEGAAGILLCGGTAAVLLYIKKKK